MFEVRLDPDLQSRGIFHGYLPLTDVEKILKAEGDYLLRVTDYQGKLICVLSIYYKGKVNTVCVNRKNKMYCFNDNHKDNRICQLLDWHQKTKTPITEKGIILKNPVTVESWNMVPNNVDLLLGDVYNCYRMKAYEVVINKEKQKIHAAALLLTSKQLQIESKKQFLAEGRVLRALSHPNILQFYGMITSALPFTMFVGLCQINLQALLQKNNVQKEQKVRFAIEAASALKYIADKGYVHKNVQAASCLIDRSMTLKMANLCFAGSDQCPPFIHQENLEAIQAGWLAPETMLKHIFSKESDIWAFGVLLWEIYENGEIPYRGLTNMEIRSYVIHSQNRLDIPKNAPPKVKRLIAQCWEENPSRRPTVHELKNTIQGIEPNEL
ncbi:unnamed protein product [Thelazia callipaeda]|uniref:Tyrosine-protein kinase n=1 Tax=Thelazia callipaeda TaxID=103827 RepID=A0A0N5CVL7_THECL|nr:unnamed protein product [Thelazia callipaeda]